MDGKSDPKTEQKSENLHTYCTKIRIENLLTEVKVVGEMVV